MNFGGRCPKGGAVQPEGRRGRILGMRIGAGVVAVLVLALSGSLAAQQSKKKTPPAPASARPVKDIMEKTHKEKGSLIFLARDAENTEADLKKLIEVY